MSIIDKSYFVGEINIPSTGYQDVDSSLMDFISIRERKYLIAALGYDLYLAFTAALSSGAPAPKYLSLLFGQDFLGLDGVNKRWEGFASVVTSSPFVKVGLSQTTDLFFVVGEGDAPADGASTYVNAGLANADYRVYKRGVGMLNAGEDITVNNGGGFTLLNGELFSAGDVYNIQILTTYLSTSGVPVTPVPVSPIADYVYFYWMRQQVTQTAGTGEVKPDNQNSFRASSRYKCTFAWNSMSEKTKVLNEFLMQNISVYPEFNIHIGSRPLSLLLKPLTAFW